MLEKFELVGFVCCPAEMRRESAAAFTFNKSKPWHQWTHSPHMKNDGVKIPLPLFFSSPRSCGETALHQEILPSLMKPRCFVRHTWVQILKLNASAAHLSLESSLWAQITNYTPLIKSPEYSIRCVTLLPQPIVFDESSYCFSLADDGIEK